MHFRCLATAVLLYWTNFRRAGFGAASLQGKVASRGSLLSAVRHGSKTTYLQAFRAALPAYVAAPTL